MFTTLDELLNLEREIGRMLIPGTSVQGQGSPLMDVADDQDEFTLSIDLPGVRREDLKITLEKGLLTISGERKKAALPEGAAWIRSEAWDGRCALRGGSLPSYKFVDVGFRCAKTP